MKFLVALFAALLLLVIVPAADARGHGGRSGERRAERGHRIVRVVTAPVRVLLKIKGKLRGNRGAGGCQ